MVSQSEGELPSQPTGTASAPRSVHRQASVSTSARPPPRPPLRRQARSAGCSTSPSPGAGARCSSRACRSPRRCSRAAASSRASSAASPRPSATGWGCSPPGSGAPSRTGTPRPPRRRVLARLRHRRRRAAACVSFGLGQYWQHEIRVAHGGDGVQHRRSSSPRPFVAVFFFCLFLAHRPGHPAPLPLGRASLLSRWFGRRAAAATGLGASSSVTVYLRRQRRPARRPGDAPWTRPSRCATPITEEGVAQPTTSLRSGGPGSLVPWDSLGREGRTFTGIGSDRERHRERSSTSRPMEPIRAYAGLDVGRGHRGARRPGGRRPRAGRRLPAGEPARRHDDGQRLGRPGPDRHASST